MKYGEATSILTQSLRHNEEAARLIICNVESLLKGKRKNIGMYPTSWLPSLLEEAGEIGKTRLNELIATDFIPKETREEIDELLTRAFPSLNL